MKYAIAALIASTSAMKIRSQAAASGAAYTCSTNFDRFTSQKGNTLDSTFVTSNMKGGLFEDPSFGPETSSMWIPMQQGEQQNANQVKGYQQNQSQYGVVWKRPSEVVSTPISLWGSEGINPKISEQGNDGDCWFLSSASALAAYPERIEAMFPGQTELSKTGAYQVRLFVRGEPINVIVDDRFPSLNISAAEGYTENYPLVNDKASVAGAYWLVILEKAMAKLNVNYTGINGGQIGEAMRFMTGMPTNEFDSNTMTEDQLWTHVTNGFAKDYNMGAGCQVSHFNMISGHAYGVIGHATLSGGASDGQKLIKMRNPWGINKYTGPWSEKSALWTADYRKQAGGYETEDIGEFYIPIEQWLTDYTGLTINYFDKSLKKTTVEGKTLAFETTWGDDNAWLEINNTVEQDVIFECLQNDARMFPDSTCDTSDSPSLFSYMMFTDKVTQVKSPSGNQSSCQEGALVFKDLPVGRFQVRMINWNGEAATKGKNSLFKLNTWTSKEAITPKAQKSYYYV